MIKKYVIVGGSKGIGLELVRAIGKSGDVVSISRTGMDEGHGIDVTEFLCDATTDELPEIEGPINGLAYCPGSINLRPFNRLSVDDFESDLRVNLFGAVRSIQKYLPALKAAERASIVLFSTVAVQTGMGFHASIAAAKGAVEGLTRSLAAEFAPAIRVNCVAPSLTDTPLAERLLNSPEKREAAAQRHPLKAFGTPQDAASVAAFLLSDETKWITGQVIHVDGGIGNLR